MDCKKTIEIGRMVVVKSGSGKGTIAFIIDIIDKNRCIVDGWAARQIINTRRIFLTRVMLKNINKKISSKKLKNKIKQNLESINKWCKGTWVQKYHFKKKKAELKDFDKFKYTMGKKHKNIVFFNR